ncbi:MAG: hypothetical protein NC218_02280 [Acetobacter sp.]|nr:hypothetical protein [Acetobacter sp.]
MYEEIIEGILAAAEHEGEYALVRQFDELRKNGQILTIPFKRGEMAWHVYPMSKTDPKRGYTYRLVSYEQIVAGLAKDPDGIYMHYRKDAEAKAKELKEKALCL